MIRSALEYASRGWLVFPVRGKEPLTRHGFHDATTDRETIERWWARHPDAGVAIATGRKSGIWVLDVDGEAGQTALDMILDREGDLPDTWESWTGGGGRHLIWRYPTDLGEGVSLRNSAGRIAEGIDVRGEGGYIVAPPSAHESGRAYRWKIPPSDGSPPLAPQWLTTIAVRRELAIGRDVEPRDPVRYAASVLRLETDEVSSAKEGTRNETLNRAAYNLGRFSARGWLSRDQIAQALTEASDLPAEETSRTIASALSAYHAPPEQVTRSWWDQLARDDDGRVYRTDRNLRIALTEHPGWRGVLGFDERFARTVFRRRAPTGDDPGEVTDRHVYRIREWLEGQIQWTVPMDRVNLVVDAVADDTRFDPVQDYLRGLEWDRDRRADLWLEKLCGAPSGSDYVRMISARWLISAVARALDPGCKADHMLVLEGRQGIKKSTALAALVGDAWFSDSLPQLGTKDSRQHLQGPWVIEIAELDAMRRAEIEAIKAFLSARFDRFRPPYARREVTALRRCVFAGTTNQDQWNHDPTGARRFWPVAVSAINVDQIARSRDQIWAEAVVRYRAGEAWWIDSPEVAELAEAEQDARYRVDEWETALLERLDDRVEPVSVGTCLQWLGIEAKDWTQAAQARVGKILRRLGFARVRRRTIDGRRYVYVPPGYQRRIDDVGDHHQELH